MRPKALPAAVCKSHAPLGTHSTRFVMTSAVAGLTKNDAT